MQLINKNSTSPRPSLSKSALAIIAPLVLAQAAFGAITINMVESGSDLIVSYDGTLALDPALVFDTTATVSGIYSFGTGNWWHGNPSHYADFAGSSTFITFTGAGGPTVSLFSGGFSGSYVAYDEAHITGGVLGAVSELTYDGAVDNFVMTGESLASIGLDGLADGTVVWTATTTGDTFIFSTAPIPEASSALLLGLGGLAFAARRRRV